MYDRKAKGYAVEVRRDAELILANHPWFVYDGGPAEAIRFMHACGTFGNKPAHRAAVLNHLLAGLAAAPQPVEG